MPYFARFHLAALLAAITGCSQQAPASGPTPDTLVTDLGQRHADLAPPGDVDNNTSSAVSASADTVGDVPVAEPDTAPPCLPANPCQGASAKSGTCKRWKQPDDQLCALGKHCLDGQCVPFKTPAKMVTLPGGDFYQGCDLTIDPKCTSFEQPRHRVKLRPFLIDLDEVTAGAYEVCVLKGLCTLPQKAAKNADIPGVKEGKHCAYGVAANAALPISCVTWQQAQDYCTAMVPGGSLPTESQWEYAFRLDCANGKESFLYSQFLWGNVWPPPLGSGNFGDESHQKWDTDENGVVTTWISGYDDGYGWLAPIGSFPADAKCLHDMSGNVTEFVRDAFAPDWYSKPEASQDDPVNLDPAAKMHVVRGGSASAYDQMRLAMRAGRTNEQWHGDFGFRCASNFIPP